jgi:hypothetical protein
MARTRHRLALCLLLSGTPVLGASVAAAQAAGTPERPSSAAAPAGSQPLNRTGTDTSAASNVTGNVTGNVSPVRPDMPAPATPMPLNLPDDAKQSEVKGEYAFGVASLIFGTLLVAAIVVGGLYVLSRRSWSTQH